MSSGVFDRMIGLRARLAPSAHTISTNCLWEQPMARKYYDKSNLPAVPLSTHHNFINLTGSRYGRLHVVAYGGREKNVTRWFCECDCGNIVKVRGGPLVSGDTRSCGCISAEILRTHGMSDQPIYKIWQMMIDRCDNPNSTAYPNYGGRGVCVCADWRTFEQFYQDMGDRPTSRHSVERIDNDGNYEPNNCVWAIRTIQGNNRRNNRILEHNGKRRTMAQWCGGTNTKHYRRTRSRLSLGWCDECALTNQWGVICTHIADEVQS